MKKLIISTLAIAALTFASCKKDNLQPTANNSTNIEQTNLETSDDDKAVDARNKFVGTWKRVGTNTKYKIQKGPGSTLKVKWYVGGTYLSNYFDKSSSKVYTNSQISFIEEDLEGEIYQTLKYISSKKLIVSAKVTPKNGTTIIDQWSYTLIKVQ